MHKVRDSATAGDAVRGAAAGRPAVPLPPGNDELYRRIVDTTREGVWVLDAGGLTTFVNGRVAEGLGYPPERFIGRPMADFLFPEDVAAHLARLEGRRLGQAEDYELRLRREDGQPVWALVSATPMFDRHGRFAGTFGLAMDITERKRMEQALSRGEREYRTLVENMPDFIVRYDTALRRTYVNPAWEKAAGLSAAEVVNLPAEAVPRVPQPMVAEYLAALRQALATGTRQAVEFSWVNAHGARLDLQYIVVPECDQDGEVVGLLAVGRDITDLARVQDELRQREAHVRRINRVLTTLGQGNQTLVRAASEQELLDNMCRLVVDHGGHALAWIGSLEADGRTIRLRAWAGSDAPDLRPDPEAHMSAAVAQAIREGRPLVTHDPASRAADDAWRQRVLASGCRVSLTLPVISEGVPLGVLSIWSADPAAFDAHEVDLFSELADDLGYGIGALRARINREAGQRRLQSTMEAAIQGLAGMAELRDPYTAGHQRRVAQLAVALGTELGLGSDRLQGIHLAAVCHDIGKIQVPAEILSKPGRLTPLEFDLIKAHVDAGYEILRAIDFPWPIADIVRQHHERLDGSGYPLGVAGDALLVESRILAVADVVEAITSHRPYRPGLGFDRAIAEIEAGRGTLFDAAVVDACVRLVQAQGFRFE